MLPLSTKLPPSKKNTFILIRRFYRWQKLMKLRVHQAAVKYRYGNDLPCLRRGSHTFLKNFGARYQVWKSTSNFELVPWTPSFKAAFGSRNKIHSRKRLISGWRKRQREFCCPGQMQYRGRYEFGPPIFAHVAAVYTVRDEIKVQVSGATDDESHRVRARVLLYLARPNCYGFIG